MPVIALLLAACWTLPDTVTFTGTVFDGPDEDATAVGGAGVATRNAALELVDETTADAEGAFSVRAAASQAVFFALDGEGYAPTAFSTMAGTEDVAVPDGALWLRSEAEVEALRETFGDCAATAGDTGGDAGATGIVEGEVRFWLPVSDPVDTWPVVTTATVTVQDGAGEEWSACYLDDDGNADPDATETGATGRFAVFGVPAGPITVRVLAAITEEQTEESLYVGYLPEGGVFPMYAALITVEE